MRGGPPPARPKKPPYPLCMKLLISYGGSFGDPRPLTPPVGENGKLRYTGGETRIISVDRRGLNLRKLLARVSELLPGVLLPLPADTPSLCLCHQLLWASDRGEGGDERRRREPPPPVPILRDEDVARMLEENDRLAALGKVARLRVFLCDREPSSAVGSSDSGASSIRSVDSWDRNGASSRGSASLDKVTAKKEPVAFGVVQERTGYAPGTRYFGHPSNPNLLQGSAPGISDSANFRKPIAKRDFTDGLGFNQPAGDGLFLGQWLGNPVASSGSGIRNRENVVPWSVAYGVAGTSHSVSLHNQMNREASSSNPMSVVRICGVTGSDARHRCSPYDSQGRRGGLLELGTGQASVLEGKVCFGKCHPVLRPRPTIDKPGQPRLNAYLGKSFDAGKGKEVLRGVERKMASRFHVQGSLPSTEFGGNLVDGRPHDNTLSYMPPELSKLSVPCALHEMVGKVPSCFPNLEQHGAQTQIYSKSDLLTCPVEYPVTSAIGPHHQMNKTDDLNSPDKESRVMQEETGSNAEAPLSSKLYSSSNVKIEDRRNDNLDSASPQLDPTTGLYPIHEAAIPIIEDDSVVKSPLKVSMYNLSLSASTKAYSPTHCSLGNASAQHPTMNTFTESLPRREIGPCSSQVVGMEDDTLGLQSVTGKLARKTDCTPSFGALRVSVDDDVVQKTVSSASNVEVKANIEQEMELIPEVVSGETSTKLPLAYTQLVTQELQTIKDTDLEEIRELGSGTYGTVFYGKWKGSDVAIKRLKPHCFSGGGSTKDRLIADFWKEAHLLGQLHHPNVVAFYGVVTDGQRTSLATVTEYMVNGSLKQVLRRKDRTIDRRKRVIIAMDAAFGMEYLHEKSVVHFDLKSHNFLVNMRDPQRPVCKIGDLGLSKVKRRTLVSGGVRGTIPWMAPELLTSQSSMVTEKVDVYSFGIVMWELLTGEEPYGDMPTEKVIAGIIKGDLRPEIPGWCDPAWRSLMGRCWASDPCSRPAFSEVVKELRAIAASMNIL